MRNKTAGGLLIALPTKAQLPHDAYGGLQTAGSQSMNYLLANRAEIPQNERIMKPRLFLVLMIITAVACASSFAQDKTSLQPNATVAGILQASAGKSIELHLRSGEKCEAKSPK
jgi:hypothetical protein